MLFLYREIDNSEDLKKAIDARRTTDGSIVIYKQTYSLIVFTITRIVYELVPNHRSVFIVGMKHAIISALLGPWSWIGPFQTVHSLVVNLSGGIDVTDQVVSDSGGYKIVTESLHSNPGHKDKIIQYGFVTVLYAIFGFVVWKFVVPVYDPTIWSGSLITTSLIMVFVVIIAALAWDD